MNSTKPPANEVMIGTDVLLASRPVGLWIKPTAVEPDINCQLFQVSPVRLTAQRTRRAAAAFLRAISNLTVCQLIRAEREKSVWSQRIVLPLRVGAFRGRLAQAEPVQYCGLPNSTYSVVTLRRGYQRRVPSALAWMAWAIALAMWLNEGRSLSTRVSSTACHWPFSSS